MAKKQKLVIDYIPDFLTIGLVSAQKQYRLCWLLNKELGTNFERKDDFCFTAGKNEDALLVPVFGYEESVMLTSYHLLANKTNNGQLFSKPAGIDYLFLVYSPNDQFRLADLIKKLRAVAQISMAVELPDAQGKKSIAFYYDFEQYLDR